MAYHVACYLPHLGYFLPELGIELHGANLSIDDQMRALAASPDVQRLELFIPTEKMLLREQLVAASERLLPPDRRGKGHLSFLPVTSMPEVFGDGQRRVFWLNDPWWLAKARYLRDQFAQGPMPIVCDTHALGSYDTFEKLSLLRGAPKVEADVMICLSSRYEVAIQRTFSHHLGGELPCRTVRIPHAIDTDWIQPATPQEKADARRNLGIPEDARVALYLGRLTPWAKADLAPMVRAFASVARSKDHLLIAGKENMEGYCDRMKQLAKDCGVGDRLHVALDIPTKEVKAVYGAADFFVFPGDTIQEGVGRTCGEAAAAGLPTLLSDWDGLADMVEHEVTGFLLPTVWCPGDGLFGAVSPLLDFRAEYFGVAQQVIVDEEVMASRMALLFQDEQRCQAMGAAARAFAERTVSVNQVHAELFRAIEEALELADAETKPERESRRESAARWAVPTPHHTLFGHYATRTLSDLDTVALTDLGRQSVGGKTQLLLYDEMLVLVQPRLFDLVLSQLMLGPKPVKHLWEQAESTKNVTKTQFLFHLGLLLKAAAIKIRSEVNLS